MSMRMRVLCYLCLLAFSVPASQIALAHHSSALYDHDQTVVLKGTVRTVEWKNPHIWLWLFVTEVNGEPVADENGDPVVWGVEATSPTELLRSKSNWKRKTLQQGDVVIVTGSPLRDGRPGAALGSITLEDGTLIHGTPPADETAD